tara:strand:- start:113 stop:580 length:468 start_codon:yes stop_codon:yes gene_type:complete
MVDPLTALSVAASAVSNAKSLLAAGRDATSAISKFAGAMSDLNWAVEKSKNPSVWRTLTGSPEAEAIELFAAQKKAQQLKKDLEVLIMFSHGVNGLEEYREVLRKVRKQRQETSYRRAELKEAIIAWTVGILVVSSALALLGLLFWWLGKTQGKW